MLRYRYLLKEEAVMSEELTYRGYLKEVENKENLSLEDLCKGVCDSLGLSLEGDNYSKSYIELLLYGKYNRYIIIEEKLFEIQDLKYYDSFDSYCNITELGDGRYSFETKFYSGGTCLSEELEHNWGNRKVISPWVSVKDKTPQEGVPVLVTYLGWRDNKPYSDEIAYFREGEWYWDEDFTKVSEVEITAWMPLPSPFEG